MKCEYSHFVFVFLLTCMSLFWFSCGVRDTASSKGNHTNMILCISREKDAMLKFKEGIKVDHCGLLTTWTGGHDCCQWHGVRCSTLSGHVISLDVSGSQYYDSDSRDFCLQGTVSGQSLAELKHLKYLDLSCNNFQGQPISTFIGSLLNLQYLNLSRSNVDGEVPIPVTISHLKHLDLSYNNFQGRKWNPEFLGSLCSLETLSLGWNNINNELSTIIQPLSQCAHRSLVSLDISYNRLWGSLPDEIDIFSSLRELLLQNNQLNGTISPRLGQLSMLETLDLSSNSLKGTISKQHMSNLSRLTVLRLNDNPELVLNISADWVPPFQLNVIGLASCKLGPYFPKWLLTQTNFYYLDISNANITDTVPTLFWNSLPSNLSYMNMSENMIHGNVPDVPIWLNGYPKIDLSSNSFHGAIPSFLVNASLLFLNNNEFSDLSPFFCPKTKVPLSGLWFSNNKLSVEFPSCWDYFDQLTSLCMDYNNISGKLPESIGVLTNLGALHLRNNNFSGKLPVALRNCTNLIILDLSHNSLTEYLPHWNYFPRLSILYLRNNNFVGALSSSLCQLSKLQVLDLSTNQLCGFIPNCIGNLTTMTWNFQMDDTDINIMYNLSNISTALYEDFAWIMWKREEWTFSNTLRLVKAIDLSNNELEGSIPDGISSLIDLKSLDLSRNRLTGSITQKIGQLTSLQVLDLSRNKLSGEIPGSISTVSSLEIFDVSYNNLSGRIPQGTQLQSFTASSYVGNPGLCGDPLSRCPGDPTPTNSPKEDKSTNHEDDDDNDDGSLFPGLYISVVLGFIVGFWGVCGSLVIKGSWRRAFFGFFDDIKDRLYVFVAVNLAKVRRRNT